MDQNFCMKCGREVKTEQVFCDECLAEMENYPVKPGVVVLLPRREEQPAKPSVRRKHPAVAPEEQVKKLKKWVAGLVIALTLSLAATAGLGWLVVNDWVSEQEGKPLPGQNYSSDASGTPESTN